MITEEEAVRLARTLADEIEHTLDDTDARDLQTVIVHHGGEITALRAWQRLKESPTWRQLVWRALESAELAQPQDVPE